jgi:thioredoxin-related protein
MDVDKKEVGPVATKYSVSSIPALFLLDENGKLLAKLDATTSPEQFAASLTRAVKANTKKTGK